MTRVLLLSSPIFGHVTPMLALGRGLRRRGHEVTLLTGSKYAASVAGAGLDFLPLPPEADYDDADLEAWLPRRRHRTRIAAGRYDITGMFVRPLGAQHRALTRALASGRYDAVVADTAVLGVLPLLTGDDPRPPVLGVSITPLALTSPDCAPFGSAMAPGRTAAARLRNRQIDFLLRHGPLRPLQEALDAQLAALGCGPCPVGYFDVARLFDTTFHLSVPGLEYPRRDLPTSVVFTGPLAPDRPDLVCSAWTPPPGDAPLVHVTQGTFANADPGALLVPCLQALADEPVRVVATTGGRPVAQVRELLGGRFPANAQVLELVPYADLLPRTDVMVTNGGWGGVQQALAQGVPVVVAGATEEKPEVAARVAWSGAGLDLRTGRPSRAGRAARSVRRWDVLATARPPPGCRPSTPPCPTPWTSSPQPCSRAPVSRPSAPPEPAAAEAPPSGLGRVGLTRRSAALLAGMSAALLASELAETVVATALPTIAADLGDLRLLALVTSGYLVAGTAVLPAYGWLGDRFGRRRVFVVAVALFLLGSALGALATAPSALVAARVVQGSGAGGLLVLVQAEVAVLVPLRQRAAVMSGVGAVFAAAVVAGPPLGGWLASGPGWRWAFWLNLPLALAALVAAVALMPRDRPAGTSRPRSPLTVLRRRQVRLATTGGLLLGASSFGMLAYLPTYLQLVHGLSPARAGLLMLALFGGLGVLTVVAAQVVRRNGPVRALLVSGALAVAAGLALLGGAGASGTLLVVVPALVLLGAGIGCVWEVVVVVVQAAARESEVGTATGANNLLREIGVVVGTAAVGAWVTRRLTTAGRIGGVPLASWSPARLAAAPPGTRTEVGVAYAAAFGPAFWALVPVALLAAVAFARLGRWSRP